MGWNLKDSSPFLIASSADEEPASKIFAYEENGRDGRTILELLI